MLIRRARKLYANDPLGVELDHTVYALDSSTIDLCLSLFRGLVVHRSLIYGPDGQHAPPRKDLLPQMHDEHPTEAPPESWDLERQGIPDYYLSRPAEAFERWGKVVAVKAWLEHTEPTHRNRRVYKPPDWSWRRIAVRDRDGERCQVCGRIDLPHDSLHTHHKHPYDFGGSHNLKNLVLLCGSCHDKEHGLIDRHRQGRFFPER